MSYKKLGDLVKFISKKNIEGTATILYGINIDKFFMPSVANTIGVDLKKYKVVTKHQFACNRMHVGRDERLPISMSTHDYDFIVSPAYDVFELTSKDVLPEYLMMWFSRKEFDRQCWFYTDADVRGGLSLDALKSIEILIPSIEEQIELVKQYHTISDKIKVNEQICEKLETTAQTLYKQWFVDFEFPNEDGKPYKSSGGEMVFNEELAKEIPEGWKVKEIKEFGKIITGKTPSSNYPEDFGDDFQFITPGDFLNEKIIIESSRKLSSLGCNRLKNKINPKNSILITCIGSDMGKVSLNYEECITNQQINSIVGNSNYYYEYLYYKLVEIKDILKSIAVGGSTMPMLNKSSFEEIKILKPSNNIIELFHSSILNNTEFYSTLKQQNRKFTQFQSLLLSRLATLER